jgi:hypothetical protein
MRNLVVAAAVAGVALVAVAPGGARADQRKLTLFPDVGASLPAGGDRPPARYLFRPAEPGGLVLEAPLFDVRLEPDGAMTIRDLSHNSARYRRLAQQRRQRHEPPAPVAPWGVSPPVYDERGQRAPIGDVLPMVPVRDDDPTRSTLNDLLFYKLPTAPWVPVFTPKLQHRQLRDATLDLRVELARAAAERRAEAALRALPAELDAIWRDDRLTEGERRGTIKALADETDPTTAAGKQAKALIDAFLARKRR